MLLVKKPGYSIENFQEILTENPRIKITEFAALKNALNGLYRESLELLVSKDRLNAYVKIYASDEEFKDKGKDVYLDEIIELARSENIIYGLEWEMILDKITNHGPILIASGKLPQNGQDATINMYKLKDLKPSVSEDDKLKALDASEIFLFPSEPGTEAFGIVTLEAMLRKNAVVASNTEGSLFLIEKDNGFIFNYGNTEKLAEYVNLLIENEKLRKSMQETNYNKAKNYINENIAWDPLEKIYLEVLNKK